MIASVRQLADSTALHVHHPCRAPACPAVRWACRSASANRATPKTPDRRSAAFQRPREGHRIHCRQLLPPLGQAGARIVADVVGVSHEGIHRTDAHCVCAPAAPGIRNRNFWRPSARRDGKRRTLPAIAAGAVAHGSAHRSGSGQLPPGQPQASLRALKSRGRCAQHVIALPLDRVQDRLPAAGEQLDDRAPARDRPSRPAESPGETIRAPARLHTASASRNCGVAWRSAMSLFADAKPAHVSPAEDRCGPCRNRPRHPARSSPVAARCRCNRKAAGASASRYPHRYSTRCPTGFAELWQYPSTSSKLS